jgi:hypothetical protein
MHHLEPKLATMLGHEQGERDHTRISHHNANDSHQRSQGEQDHEDCATQEEVPKCIRGLVPGGPVPGAIDIRGRPSGDLPIWDQEYSHENNDDDCTDNDSSMDRNQGFNHSSSSNNDPTSRDVETAAHGVVLTAEIARTRSDEIILIDGVRTTNPKLRRLCVALRFLVLFAVVTVSAGLITTRLFTSSGNAPSPDNEPKTSAPASQDAQSPSMTTPTVSRGNLSWTCADTIVHSENEGSIVGWYVSTIKSKIYLDLINRTDINFTIFGISGNANIFAGEFSSLLTQIVTPLWYGHFVSVSCIVVGNVHKY